MKRLLLGAGFGLWDTSIAISFLILVLPGCVSGVDEGQGEQEPVVEGLSIPIRDPDEIQFKTSTFTFARIQYSGDPTGRWSTDWPKADVSFSAVVERYTGLAANHPVVLELTDPSLRQYPFIYIVEAGSLRLTDAEVTSLREYLLDGGFLMVDDFWGADEWQNFAGDLGKIFPDREVEEIPLDHEIFHAFFDIEEILQVPNVNNGCAGNRTDEQDGYTPYALAVFDDNRIPMMMINYNTDIGDGWEWADQPCYPNEFAAYAYEMGLNVVVYALSH